MLLAEKQKSVFSKSLKLTCPLVFLSSALSTPFPPLQPPYFAPLWYPSLGYFCSSSSMFPSSQSFLWGGFLWDIFPNSNALPPALPQASRSFHPRSYWSYPKLFDIVGSILQVSSLGSTGQGTPHKVQSSPSLLILVRPAQCR